MESENLSKKYQEFEQRSSSLMPIFKITSFIHKYRIFRPFLYVPSPMLNAGAYVLGPLVLKKPKLEKQIKEGLEALYPNMLSESKKNKLYAANTKYMAMLYIDAMFHSSNIFADTLSKFVQFRNKHYLDEALKQGKGAIVPTTHVGMFFQVLASLAYHRPRYQVTTVIQPRNKVMYENILTRPELTNFHVVPSTSFKKIKPILENNLKNNHILVIYYDYSSVHQMRVPFDIHKYPYLITSPQSMFKLHRVTKAPIIPGILRPNGEFGKSQLEFLDPVPISQVSSKYWNANEKIYLGELSIKLNEIFAPHLRKYNHLWEEFRKFTTRTSDYFSITEETTLKGLLLKYQKKILQIIKQSYEHNRPDGEIIKNMEYTFNKAQNQLKRPKMIFKDIPITYDLSLMDALSEIVILLNGLQRNLDNFKENNCLSILGEFSTYCQGLRKK